LLLLFVSPTFQFRSSPAFLSLSFRWENVMKVNSPPFGTLLQLATLQATYEKTQQQQEDTILVPDNLPLPPSSIQPFFLLGSEWTGRIDCAMRPQPIPLLLSMFTSPFFLSMFLGASIAKLLEKRLKEKTCSLTEMQRSIQFLRFDRVSI
jgi:hypothetical protein